VGNHRKSLLHGPTAGKLHLNQPSEGLSNHQRGCSSRQDDRQWSEMHTLEHRSLVWLPRPATEVFAFFSDVCNLEKLTPAWLSFSILTPCPIQVKVGTLIDYQLRIRGFPVRWQTEITVWEPPNQFVDEQRRGPYRYWRHEHTFSKRNAGTEVVDFIRYRPVGGAVINWLFVRRDVEKIFAFRREVLLRLFGKGSCSSQK